MENYLNSETKIAKLLSWIKNHKIATFVIVIIFALFSYFVFSKKEVEKKIPPIPIQVQEKKLELVSVAPDPPIYKSIWSTDIVTFTFDQSIDPDSIRYNIFPYVETRLRSEIGPSNSFSIIPLSGWKSDREYTITVFKQLSSLVGEKLNKNITFKFMRLLPEPGDPEFPVSPEEK